MGWIRLTFSVALSPAAAAVQQEGRRREGGGKEGRRDGMMIAELYISHRGQTDRMHCEVCGGGIIDDDN